MKPNRRLHHWVPSALGGLVLACSTCLSIALPDNIVASFDDTNSLSSWKQNKGPAGSSYSWDGAVDAEGSASSGSMHVVVNYADVGNDWQEMQLQNDIAWPWIDLAPYAYVEFDVKPDVANSYPAFDGNWATIGVTIADVNNGWGWSNVGVVDVTGTGWTHGKLSLASYAAVKMGQIILVPQTKWNAYPTNTIAYWIDNIKLTVPPQAPMPIAIQRSGPGVEIDGTQMNAGNSQRQLIRTTGNDYRWVGASGPVTYSFTIAGIPASPTNTAPAAATNIPEVDFFLVGNSPNPGGGVDWNETNVIYLQLAQVGTDTAAWNAQLFYKTNADHANSQYWSQCPAAIWSTPKLLGTWSVTFGTDNSVTLTSPAGTTSSGTFPPEAAAFFNTTVVPYVGIQPYGLYNPAVIFSHFGATGVPTPLDDGFADLSHWTKTASDNQGIAVHPAGTVFQLSWLGPASGFNLEQSTDFATWSDSVAAGVSSPAYLCDYKKAWLPASALPSAGAGYFRLVQRFGGQLQVLLPGETNAPNTPTGKNGTPNPQTVFNTFDLTINRCDATWHIIPSSDTVAITSSDPMAGLPPDTALVNGTVTISGAFYFSTPGTWTITATDVTTNSVSAGTSSPIRIP